MGPEHAPVDVGLVDHHVLQLAKKPAPVLVVGEDAEVEHVRVGEDYLRLPTAPDPVSSVGVSPSKRADVDLSPGLCRRPAVLSAPATGPGRGPWSGNM